MCAGQQRKRFWPAFVLGCNAAPATPNPATLRPATQQPSDPATRQPSNSVPSDPATQRPRNPAPCNTATQHSASDTLRVRRTVASLSASNAGNPADCDIEAGHRAESCRNLPETVQTLPDPRASSRRGEGRCVAFLRKPGIECEKPGNAGAWIRSRVLAEPQRRCVDAPDPPREAAAPALGPALIVSATWML